MSPKQQEQEIETYIFLISHIFSFKFGLYFYKIQSHFVESIISADTRNIVHTKSFKRKKFIKFQIVIPNNNNSSSSSDVQFNFLTKSQKSISNSETLIWCNHKWNIAIALSFNSFIQSKTLLTQNCVSFVCFAPKIWVLMVTLYVFVGISLILSYHSS